MTSLERIEEKHPTDRDFHGEFCRRCDRWQVPCDVVKLSRALAEAAEGVDNDQLRDECERVLVEVAGASEP